MLLSSDNCPDPTGKLYEVGSGWQARTRWQRSGGHGFPIDVKLTPEAVLEKWDRIINFNDGRADHPEDAQDGLKSIMANFQNRSSGSKVVPANANNEILSNIENAKKAKSKGSEFTYNEKDVILYSKLSDRSGGLCF